MLRFCWVLALLIPRVAAAYDLTTSSTGQPVSALTHECETQKRDLAADDLAGVAELDPAPAGSGGCAAGGDVSLGVLVIGAFLIVTRRSWRSRAVLRHAALVGTILVAVIPAQAAQLRRLAERDGRGRLVDGEAQLAIRASVDASIRTTR